MKNATKQCFVISPIGEPGSNTRSHADKVLTLLVEPAMKALGIEPIRADRLDKPGRITNQMFTEIFKADLCISVLTGHNPNVFYELAIAQSINKPVIVLITKEEELPFDIKDLRCIKYDLENDSLQTHVNTIIKFAKSFEENNWKVDDIFQPYRHLTDFFVDPEVIAAHQNIHRFCQRAKGYWWSIGADPQSIGIVEFKHEETINTLELIGRAYDAAGQLLATWETIVSCIHPKKQTLYYYWDGEWTTRPNDHNEGFGEITFFDSADDFVTGKGEFFDRRLSSVKSTTMKRSDFRRCSTQEVTAIKEHRIPTLVRKKLKT
jgi:hypothetical protein